MTIHSNISAYSSYGSSGVSSSSKNKGPNFEEMAQQLTGVLDTNSSGSIDKAEFSAAAEALASSSSSAEVFSKIDTNSDESMSSEELIAALKNMKQPESPQGKVGGMPPPPPPPPPPSDSTSSSESSEATSLSEIFSTLDTNQDGTISAEELMALFSDSKNESGSTANANSDTASVSATATSATSTTTSASQEDTMMSQRSQNLLKQMLSSYGSYESTASQTKSLLSLSA